ncbi:uncharacterized protein LOC113455526 isoform X4 [Microtus ochrogaster]|nr:uncharacterized protein LOC113455526 isoform X4 [Microtus ochrogaster]
MSSARLKLASRLDRLHLDIFIWCQDSRDSPSPGPYPRARISSPCPLSWGRDLPWTPGTRITTRDFSKTTHVIHLPEHGPSEQHW